MPSHECLCCAARRVPQGEVCKNGHAVCARCRRKARATDRCMYCEPLAPPARASAGESGASTTTWREDCVLVVRICMRDLLWLAAVLLLFMYAGKAVVWLCAGADRLPKGFSWGVNRFTIPEVVTGMLCCSAMYTVCWFCRLCCGMVCECPAIPPPVAADSEVV